MMDAVDPVVKTVAGYGGCEPAQEITHPAFAQIRASRQSQGPGGRFLYGSDFRHNHYVAVSIARSSLRRDLSHDWPHEGNELIEVVLSESQWATFVSSLNCGQGTQCTIQHEHCKQIPGIASTVDRLEQFKGEAQKTLGRVTDSLSELEGMIDGLKMSAKAKEELHGLVNTAKMNLTCNLDFVAKSFSEHVERTVDKAKTEVNAYMQAMVARSGIEALQGKMPLLIEQQS